MTIADWLLVNLGPDHRIAASKADAKVLGAYNQYPFTDTARSIRDMFFSEGVGESEQTTLVKRNIEYVVADRKLISWDHMLGYYFYNQQNGSSSDLKVVAVNVFEKFDGLEGVNRMVDAGDIVVYDVEKYLALNNPGSKAASTNSRASNLHIPVTGVKAVRLPASNNTVFPAAGGSVQPMILPGNERGSGANQVYSRMPVQSGICGAQSNDKHVSLYMKLKIFIYRVIQTECRDGRMP